MIPMTLVGMVGIVLGSVVGEKVASRLSVNALRKLIYIGVGVSGVIMLIQKLI